MNGKGSKPRPYQVKLYNDNFDSIDWKSAEKPARLGLEAESTAEGELKAFKITVENFNPYLKDNWD
jgi:hypothetical protein